MRLKALQKHALFDNVSEDIQDRGIYPSVVLNLFKATGLICFCTKADEV